MVKLGTWEMIGLAFVVTACGIPEARSYGALSPLDGNSVATKGRDDCGSRAKQHGNLSTVYSTFGWASGLASAGVATAALAYGNDQGSAWKEHRETVLLAGSGALAALAYAFIYRSDAHSDAASRMIRDTGGDNDEQAYVDCLDATAEVYSSRKAANAILTEQVLKRQEAEQRAATKVKEVNAAADEVVAAKSALESATKTLADAQAELNRNTSDAVAQKGVNSAQRNVAVAQAKLELSEAKLAQAQLPDDASKEAKDAAAALVNSLRLKVIAAQAAAFGVETQTLVPAESIAPPTAVTPSPAEDATKAAQPRAKKK